MYQTNMEQSSWTTGWSKREDILKKDTLINPCTTQRNNVSGSQNGGRSHGNASNKVSNNFKINKQEQQRPAFSVSSGGDPLRDIKKRHPQAFILGAGKCGTGTLRRFLASHPNIVVPSTEETWFYDNFYKKGESWHLSLMPTSSPDQITIENSPGYFHHHTAMSRIIKDNPHGLFIVILRDPIDRAISHYLHQLLKPPLNLNQTALGFEASAIRDGKVNSRWHLIDYGIYSKVLKLWLKKIPLKRFYIIDGTSFAKNPLPSLQGIEEFLGIPPYFDESKLMYNKTKGFYCLRKTEGKPDCMPKTKGRDHPQLNLLVMDKLKAFYKPFNEELYKILGRRFNWK